MGCVVDLTNPPKPKHPGLYMHNIDNIKIRYKKTVIAPAGSDSD